MPLKSLAAWDPVNPSLSGEPIAESIYRYYAGFRRDFAREALTAVGAGVGTTVMDPWNGSGTTTAAARELGCVGYGFDRNPCMAFVAKAKLLDESVSPSIPSLTSEIVTNFKRRRSVDQLDDESLRLWFTQASAEQIRTLEHETHRLLVGNEQLWPLVHATSLKDVSSLAAFFYVAWFNVVKTLVRKFRSSNPTWIRKAAGNQISVETDDVIAAFQAEVTRMQGLLRARTTDDNWSLTGIELASSRQLPLKDGVVDAIVTSPPYCTRIDYVIASMPELAVLGFGKVDVQSLRGEMIGTLITTDVVGVIDPRWGATCAAFLDRVRGHASHASSTYYLKNHLQYFRSMFDSLGELNRVLRTDGRCIMVVQDSYYKEVHNDVATMLTEMASSRGWHLERKVDFAKKVTLARVNPKTKRYGSPGSAIESVLAFEKVH